MPDEKKLGLKDILIAFGISTGVCGILGAPDIIRHFTDKTKNTLPEQFIKYDTDNNGVLEPKEAEAYLKDHPENHNP